MPAPQQRRVEAVGRVREVGLHGRGPQPRVDPDEEQPQQVVAEPRGQVGDLDVAERLELGLA